MCMNVNEIRSEARQKVIEMLMPEFMDYHAVKFGDGSFAIPVKVEDTDVWVEVSVKTKAWTPTKKSAAFNPHDKAAEWQALKKMKKA